MGGSNVLWGRASRKRQRAATGGEINGSAFDRYTVAHAASGVALGLRRIPWWAALGLAIVWEIVERPLKDRFPNWFPNATQDSLANSVVDVGAVMAGWGVMMLFPRKPQ